MINSSSVCGMFLGLCVLAAPANSSNVAYGWEVTPVLRMAQVVGQSGNNNSLYSVIGGVSNSSVCDASIGVKRFQSIYDVAKDVFGDTRSFNADEAMLYEAVLVSISKPTGRNLFDMV